MKLMVRTHYVEFFHYGCINCIPEGPLPGRESSGMHLCAKFLGSIACLTNPKVESESGLGGEFSLQL